MQLGEDALVLNVTLAAAVVLVALPHAGVHCWPLKLDMSPLDIQACPAFA